MIEVISRSFGISDRKERSAARIELNNVKPELRAAPVIRRGEKDLFDLARGIAFRARKRRIRSSGII